jgi:hypothetical protein
VTPSPAILEAAAHFDEIHSMTPPQRRFVLGSSRRNQLFLGGAGSGKTHGLMLKAEHLALRNPGKRGAIYGRTMSDVRDTLLPLFYSHLDDFKRETGITLLKGVNRGHAYLTLTDGTAIEFRGYDQVDKLRGRNLAWAVVDEIEHSRDPLYAFTTIKPRIRVPCALPQLGVATTPDGLRGCTAHFLEMQRQGNRDYFVVRSTVYDNPFLPEGFIEDMKASMSKRQWEQEGEGKILKPKAAVFSEFDEDVHVVPYVFNRKAAKPFILAVDWGTSHAYFCCIEYDQMGRWVVCYEEKHEETSATAFRESIRAFIRSRPMEPDLIAVDRAVPSENNWAVGTFRQSWVRGMESKKEQSVVRGIEMVRYMLDPSDGPPRLYLSEELSSSLLEPGRGLRGALTNAQFRRDMDGHVTNQPKRNDINSHPCDALRYAVVASADRPQFHGGAFLPCIMPSRDAA